MARARELTRLKAESVPYLILSGLLWRRYGRQLCFTANSGNGCGPAALAKESVDVSIFWCNRRWRSYSCTRSSFVGLALFGLPFW
jgi:hypothetical protein